MKKSIFLLILFLPILIFSQENNVEENDSISNTNNNTFIEDHSEQLNIKFDVTNDQLSYYIPFEEDKATIKTNLNVSLGFVFSYKFLSVRLGVRPGLSDSNKENKGETDFFRIKVKLLFDKWTHRFEYNYTRGFYIENTDDFGVFDTSSSNYHVQFPYLTTNIISGSTHYNFNDNYSVKAVESNTEIQLKSVGTFLLGVSYSFYDLAGTDSIKDENGDILTKTSYNEYAGFSATLNGGYYYTFILKSYWYVNLRVNPGIAFNFYDTTYYSENSSEKKSNTEVFIALNTGVTAGYNGKKYYFGAEFNYNGNTEKFNDDKVNLIPIKNNFHIFIGYRFKAPKQVTKPVDYIEKKMPILKDGDN